MRAPIVIMPRYAGERQSGVIMTVIKKSKRVQVIHFNGREFRRITWIPERVIVVWAVRKHINAHVMRATLMTRREI
jgi:hypothetical protein